MSSVHKKTSYIKTIYSYSYLSNIIYLFISSVCVLLVKERVFAVNSDEGIPYASNFENILCSDVFENNQCKFIEMAMEISINSIYQNVMEKEILMSKQVEIVAKEQIKEIKNKIELGEVYYEQERVNISKQINQIRHQNKVTNKRLDKLEKDIIKACIEEITNAKKYNNIHHEQFYKDFTGVGNFNLQLFQDKLVEYNRFLEKKHTVNPSNVRIIEFHYHIDTALILIELK